MGARKKPPGKCLGTQAAAASIAAFKHRTLHDTHLDMDTWGHICITDRTSPLMLLYELSPTQNCKTKHKIILAHSIIG